MSVNAHDTTYDQLDAIYTAHRARPSAIAPHLYRLREFALTVDSVTEFGVKQGASSSAFLMGLRQTGGVLTSYDIALTKPALQLAHLMGDRWRYRHQSSLEAPREPTDILFIDSLHTYAQTRAELERHADSVAKRIIFHDTMTFGSVGADGESGKQLWDHSHHRGQSVPEYAYGIRPAIDHLMAHDYSWRIHHHYLDSHGLLVLDRRAL